MMPISWDYIAGFFDGEGTVLLNPSAKGTKVSVSMSNTNRQVLEEIIAFMGYGRIFTQKPRKAHWKTAFQLQIASHKRVLHFCQNVARFSIIKRQRLIVAMQYIEGRTWSNAASNPLGLANPAQLEKAYWLGSAKSVAKKYGVTPGAITSFLASHNMPRRPPYPPYYRKHQKLRVAPELIQRIYWVEGKTYREIAQTFHVHPETVRHFMKRHGIPRRVGKKSFKSLSVGPVGANPLKQLEV